MFMSDSKHWRWVLVTGRSQFSIFCFLTYYFILNNKISNKYKLNSVVVRSSKQIYTGLFIYDFVRLTSVFTFYKEYIAFKRMINISMQRLLIIHLFYIISKESNSNRIDQVFFAKNK